MDGSQLQALLRSKVETMPNKARRVVEYLLANAREAAFLSIGEVAEKLDVSKAQLVRVARLVGFDGYAALKDALKDLVLEQVNPAAHLGRALKDWKRMPEEILRLDSPVQMSARIARKDVVAAGVDQVALDAFGATLLGHKPQDIGHIVEAAARGLGGRSTPRRLSEISGEAEERLPLPIAEFARVLGGGVVPGSIVLVGGDPGIGKSTLMLQVAVEMAESGRPVLYVSGEESEKQIRMRALRLLVDDQGKSRPVPESLYLVTETNLETILEHVHTVHPFILIVDSIQPVYLPDMSSSAGSVGQVRECSARLRELAKSSNVAVFVIGHVTKEGVIAGPRVLEHIVDTVLYLEGERFHSYRLLRSVKNRFGSTNEVGVFEMDAEGLREVSNPSEVFLSEPTRPY